MDVDLDACVSGCKHAWDAFVDRSTGLIVAAVRRTVGGRGGGTAPQDVDDHVQEVFVRLVKDDYRLLRSYDPARASLSTWLTLVARSVTIDQMRRRRPAATPLDDRDLAEPAPASSEAPELPMHLLSPRQRLVLRMLFDREMTVPEAAGLLGVDEQTIRSTKHKALSRLREHLAPR